MNSKKIIIIVLSIFTVYSCSNKDDKLRKDIIGTYHTIENEEDEDFYISVDGYDTYSADGTYLSSGKLSILTADEDLGSVNLKYTVSVTGKYRIENSKLLIDYDLNTFSMIYEGTDNVIIDFELILYFQQFRKQLENIIISNFKEWMIKTDTYKIIELSTEKMVVVDSEGNESSSKRVVQKSKIPEESIPEKNINTINQKQNEVYSYEKSEINDELIGDFDHDGKSDRLYFAKCNSDEYSNLVVITLSSQNSNKKFKITKTSSYNLKLTDKKVIKISGCFGTGRYCEELLFRYEKNLNTLRLIGYSAEQFPNYNQEGGYSFSVNLLTNEIASANSRNKIHCSVITIDNYDDLRSEIDAYGEVFRE